jgi:hypothetical protein
MDASFYMVPFLMALAGTGLLVVLGVRRHESPRQIASDALLSAVVALMFLAKLVTRWWIPLSFAWGALLLKILLKITRPKSTRDQA